MPTEQEIFSTVKNIEMALQILIKAMYKRSGEPYPMAYDFTEEDDRKLQEFVNGKPESQVIAIK